MLFFIRKWWPAAILSLISKLTNDSRNEIRRVGIFGKRVLHYFLRWKALNMRYFTFSIWLPAAILNFRNVQYFESVTFTQLHYLFLSNQNLNHPDLCWQKTYISKMLFFFQFKMTTGGHLEFDLKIKLW